ncbi:MAG: UbiA family prenyltransferase [Halobacteriaceae archaeon]
MALVRHGRGPRAAVAALASQVHPVFMLPPVAASGFGGLLSGGYALGPGLLHACAVFAGLYTAHVKDGYVDFYVRDEDDDHPLTARGCWVAVGLATAAFAICLGGVWATAGPLAAALTAPGWAIGYLHAPQLDTNPVTATAGYPAGIALALLGGFAAQTGALSARVGAFAAVLLVVVSGIKVIDDAQDVAYDRSIGKRTVAVALGVGRARRVAHALLGAGLLGVVALGAVRVFPPSTAAASVVLGAVAVAARGADPERATMLLVRGSYLFLAVLLATTWTAPLGG